jgi:hypothetical protein
MKLSHSFTLAPLLLTGVSSTRFQTDLADRQAIIDTLIAFSRSLDDKSPPLMRSVTTKDLVFDGTLFADIGLGLPEPLVGQDAVGTALFGALTMPTAHYLSNFHLQRDRGANHANLTAYALATHHKQLEEPRQNPNNLYVQSNRWHAGLVKDKGEWKIEWFKVQPVWQSGNIVVMGLWQ